MFYFKHLVVLLVMVVMCNGFGGVAQATSFTNGSFDSGFSGWNGSFVDPFNVVDPDASPSQFSLAGANNAAQLQNNDNDWIVTLFQGFTVDSLTSPANKLNLSFSVKWQPTESSLDGFSATLGGVDLLAGVTTAELLSGVDLTVDVTSVAGSLSELGFTIMDWDYLTPDFLLVDNIAFNQVATGAAPVPEPGTFLLFGIGLAGVAFVKNRKKTSI
ncbi:MAG: PEP-CTERM sorting domain-containing protein [Nostocales cyanobacterium W4_Combined_metabat2_030]|nr:PEP-CTERM sorting domain-containing protein [Nostocales cyanobacterium W4_Combined_metabat2_030]